MGELRDAESVKLESWIAFQLKGLFDWAIGVKIHSKGDCEFQP